MSHVYNFKLTISHIFKKYKIVLMKLILVMYEFPVTAVINHHKLDELKENIYFFLAVLVAKTPKSVSLG